MEEINKDTDKKINTMKNENWFKQRKPCLTTSDVFSFIISSGKIN